MGSGNPGMLGYLLLCSVLVSQAFDMAVLLRSYCLKGRGDTKRSRPKKGQSVITRDRSGRSSAGDCHCWSVLAFRHHTLEEHTWKRRQ